MQAGDTLAIEDLTDIREGCKQRKKQRGLIPSLEFRSTGFLPHLQSGTQGHPRGVVDPRYSSRTCSKCGHCEKKNRKSQSLFCCKVCGYTVNADYNAAQNLRQRGIASLARLMSDSQSQPIATLLCSPRPLERLSTTQAEWEHNEPQAPRL